ncbi:structural maintenance of chromosomes protein 5 [Selaginella moellendorffii]|uniref:structural maintenance of chromosomes protein 5 n=1 Tax=Selaginella moellendorffii TaxID=88036 RepID=UPI000D1CCF29|nr:structural maintenance of chromosomes protein 5 [Selaginella moellendorffii]|eukprot:XP_024515429.1 structural maintenance of chromosomes protein 5 [Selaginella moellendorffii]
MFSSQVGTEPPPRKRAKISAERDHDDYMRGNITQIRVHNFMTYSDITSKPGPRLNLVIGPNGTGKSSLVCALAIGLGGEPQLLGRAGHIGDYVKRGEDCGWVEITLRGDSPDASTIIKRSFNKQNKSEWQLNGRSSTKKAVLESVQQFNIQVNNLTQFLPQDRVCEFAKMTPIELLAETEKAVGDPELSHQHEKLVTLNQQLKQRQLSVRQLENALRQHRSNNAELEKDVERVQERNRLLEKAESMSKKLPWLMYDKDKNMYVEGKKRLKAAGEVLKVLTEQLAGLKRPIDDKKKKKSTAESALRKLREEISKSEVKRREIGKKETDWNAKVKAKQSHIEDAQRNEANRVERIRNNRRQLQEAEDELARFPDIKLQTEETAELCQRITDLEGQAQDKKRLVQELERSQNHRRRDIERWNNRLSEIANVTNQRLDLLKRYGCPQIYEAYRWVESHRQEFRREVYGPVLVEVNIPNKDLAAYVEGQVANYIWKSFVTQDAQDRDLLVRNLKQYDVPVINFTGDEPPVPGMRITPQMESLGVSGRLDQVIAGPQVVKDVLVGQFALNYSFIGSAESNIRANEVNGLGIKDLWTPENHFRWQESRYGGHVSASVNPVRPARMFSPSVDTTESEELQRRKVEAESALALCNNDLRARASEQRELEDQAAELHRQREAIVRRNQAEVRRRKDLELKIDQRRRTLASSENEEDLQIVVDRHRFTIKDLNLKRCSKAIELKDILIHTVNVQISHNIQYLESMELDAEVRQMERDIRAQETRGAQAQRTWDECKVEVESLKSSLANAKEIAEKKAPLTPELQAAFAEMPDTIEDLEDAIETAKAQARAVIFSNPNVLEEYERRCEQIKSGTARLEVETNALNSCVEEMNTIQSTWLTTLREIVARINSTFSRNFKEMAVAGEVSLDEQGTDFDKYGIHIKVKFRETGELQVLSAHHQSGGERSVSTILYLVSLQDLTHCPFRVVDEINQGMDPFNERKMFQQLVRAASQPNTPQCFLLTPKLLPELEYSTACSILYIMNGPWIAAPSEVWKNGERWSRQFASSS